MSDNGSSFKKSAQEVAESTVQQASFVKFATIHYRGYGNDVRFEKLRRKHFFQVLVKNPIDVFSYCVTIMFRWISNWITHFVKDVAVLTLLQMLFLYFTKGSKIVSDTSAWSATFVLAFTLSLCLSVISIGYLAFQYSNSHEYGQKYQPNILTNRIAIPIAPLWFTIWEKENGKNVPYDYFMNPTKNELLAGLNSGFEFVTSYSNAVLQNAYNVLSYKERFLVLKSAGLAKRYKPQKLDASLNTEEIEKKEEEYEQTVEADFKKRENIKEKELQNMLAQCTLA